MESDNFKNAFGVMFEQLNNKNLVQGENGALAESSMTNNDEDFNGFLAELFQLQKDANEGYINATLNNLNNIIRNTNDTNVKKEYLVKLVKMCLFLRECRKGKGLRKVFYHIVNWMWFEYKDIAKFMIELIKDFGYFGDFSQLFEMNYKDFKIYSDATVNNYLIDVYAAQLTQDLSYYNVKEYNKMSLAAKWAPRENSKYNNFSKELAKKLCRPINLSKSLQQTKKSYRKLIAKLNAVLNTTETFMCDKKWSMINFENVPSVTMTSLTKAFQDQYVSFLPKDKRPLSHNKELNRRHKSEHVDFQDRETCRNNLLQHISLNKNIKSACTDLSKIVDNYFRSNQPLDVVWETQWNNRVNEIRLLIKENNISPSIFPMIDLSSSMSGTPMIAAITLGLFTSTLLDNEDLTMPEGMFANMFMTFDSKPQLGKLARGTSLYEKIQSLKVWRDKWGGSTNIELALDLLLDIGVKNNVSCDKMPKVLAIFSDMQFDQGDKNWNFTSYEMIKAKFTSKNYDVPHVLFWNLRSNTQGFQVKADTPNTSMVSGYSTRMMDLFLTSSIEEMQNELNMNNLTNANTLTLMEKIYTHNMFEIYNDKINNIVNKQISVTYKKEIDSPANDPFGDIIKQMMGGNNMMNMDDIMKNMMNTTNKSNISNETNINVTNVTNVRFSDVVNNVDFDDFDDELDEGLTNKNDKNDKKTTPEQSQSQEQTPCVIS
jgi:hypothetical protein